MCLYLEQLDCLFCCGWELFSCGMDPQQCFTGRDRGCQVNLEAICIQALQPAFHVCCHIISSQVFHCGIVLRAHCKDVTFPMFHIQ